jgi:hypothetical protein
MVGKLVDLDYYCALTDTLSFSDFLQISVNYKIFIAHMFHFI